MHLTLATVVEQICGTNGCDVGETVLGVALILAIALFAIVLVSKV